MNLLELLVFAASGSSNYSFMCLGWMQQFSGCIFLFGEITQPICEMSLRCLVCTDESICSAAVQCVFDYCELFYLFCFCCVLGLLTHAVFLNAFSSFLRICVHLWSALNHESSSPF